MRCPECGAEVRDEDAVFCARCGRPLADPAGDVTESIDVDEPRTTEIGRTGELAAASANGAKATGTQAADEADATPRPGVSRVTFPVRDLLDTTVRSFRTGGWGEAILAALIGFAGLLLVGLVLIMGAKMEFPDLGSGSNPLTVLAWVVMIGLAILGAPLNLGRVTISAFPLGALLAAGLFIMWAARNSLRGRDAYTRGRRAAEGAKVGLPFGVLCWLAALLFRHDLGQTVVSVGPALALLLGLLWGAVFGALGGLHAQEPLRTSFGFLMGRVRSRSVSVYEGIVAAGVMLGATTVLCAVAALLWIIVALARGGPGPGFTVGDAFAGIIYLVAFLPNVLVSLASLALGAPLRAGAQVTVQGRSVGGLEELSIFHWGDAGAPWFGFFLLLIPLAACVLGGFSARRSTSKPGAVLEILGSAALTFAMVLGSLAVLSQARLGAGLVRDRGFALIAPDAVAVTFLALLWAAGAGWLGWKLAETQAARNGRASGTGPS